ncbi:MAG: hypothetical protein RR140_01260 [Clostridia bacterium]
MMKNKAIKKLNEELMYEIPDIKNKIKAQLFNSSIKSKKQIWKPVFVMIISLCLIFTCVFVPSVIKTNINNEFHITLSINPRVEIITDKNGIVTEQIALNEDGVKLLFKENLLGLSIKNATEKIIYLAETYGYLTSGKQINIFVDDGKNNVLQQKSNEIINFVDNYSTQIGLKNVVVSQIDINQINLWLQSYSKSTLDNFELTLNNEFFAKLLTCLDSKIKTYNLFSQELLNFDWATATDEAIKYNIEKIKVFGARNNFDLLDYDFDNIDNDENIFELVEELCNELKEKATDLAEILKDLNTGGDEDEYLDVLQDLIEVAKELINGKND